MNRDMPQSGPFIVNLDRYGRRSAQCFEVMVERDLRRYPFPSRVRNAKCSYTQNNSENHQDNNSFHERECNKRHTSLFASTSTVGAVYDRAYFVDSAKSAVTDRAYSRCSLLEFVEDNLDVGLEAGRCGIGIPFVFFGDFPGIRDLIDRLTGFFGRAHGGE